MGQYLAKIIITILLAANVTLVKLFGSVMIERWSDQGKESNTFRHFKYTLRKFRDKAMPELLSNFTFELSLYHLAMSK